MFQTKVVEKIKTHIVCSVTFFFFENRADYQTIWGKKCTAGRPQMTIWRMLIACWIPKATDTHSEYVILTPFLQQQWSNVRASILCYTCTARLVNAKNIR